MSHSEISTELARYRTFLAYKRTFLAELRTNSIFLGISLIILNFYKNKFSSHHKLFILGILFTSTIIYLLSIYTFYLISIENDEYSISAFLFAVFLILFNLFIMFTIYKM